MAYIFSNDTSIYSGVVDVATCPVYGDVWNNNQVMFRGEDNLLYTLTVNSTSGFTFYTVDTDAGQRSSAFSLSSTDIETMVVDKSGLTAPYFSFGLVGVVQTTGYILFAALDSGFVGTVFGLFKVNSSGLLECVGAVRFQHFSQVEHVFYNTGVVSQSGNKTETDSILLFYNGTGYTTTVFFYGWRLPSPSQFASFNGTTYNSTVTGRNWIDMSGSWDGRFGSHLSNQSGGRASYRGCSAAYWVLPYSADESLETRLFYYVGKAETQFHTDYPSSLYASDFVNDAKTTYPDGFVGYLKLGDTEFSTSSAWAPDTTRYIDQDILREKTGTYTLMPFVLHDADGTTIDEKGYGDFGVGPTVSKISSGPGEGAYVVGFASALQTYGYDQYGYTGGNDVICRWQMFVYYPDQGYHRLVSKGSFAPVTRTQLGIGTSNPLYNSMDPYLTSVEYDPETRNLLWSYHATFWGDSESTRERNAFGKLGVLIDFNWGTGACFLQETDTTYYDFVARYPDG